MQSQVPTLMFFHNTLRITLLLLCKALNLREIMLRNNELGKDRETKGEREIIYFQLAVNLVCTFLYVNGMYILMSAFAAN